MKTTKSLFLAFASLGLFACSNEDVVPQQGNGDHSGTFITLTLTGAENGASRTVPGEDGTQNGTSDESVIANALVILADNTGKVLSTSSVSTFKATAAGQETYPIEVGTGTYYVYVVANPGTIAVPVKNDNITSFGKTVKLASDFSTNGKFIMFSECNGNGEDEVQGVPITVTAANDYDNPAKAANPIKLDRLAAKLTYTATAVDISAAQGQLADLTAIAFDGFNVVNGIKDFYLQQHWSAAAPATGSAPWVNTLLTPTVDNNADANFYNRWDSFRTITKGAGDSYTAAADLKVAFATTPLYCLENNSGSKLDNCFAAGSDLNGNTTGVIFKAAATVTGSDGLAGTNCFYAYNGEYFATLAALQAAYPGVFDDKVESTDAAAELAAATAELTAAKAGTAAEDEDVKTISDFRVKYNIHVYENGVMYYTHYITDQNYTASNGATPAVQVKYQSVMRNTVYGLTVNSVKNIGDDIPGGWNPDTDPEDPTNPKTYLVVECQVNPWVLSNYEIDLQ